MTLHTKLNEISNDEFDSISYYTPVEKFLDISFESFIESYNSRKEYNLFNIETKNKEQKDVFIKCITLIDFLKFLIGKYKCEDLENYLVKI